METAIVIPARYGSSRLYGKPLVMIGGKTLLQRTLDAAIGADVGRVVVATDSVNVANTLADLRRIRKYASVDIFFDEGDEQFRSRHHRGIDSGSERAWWWWHCQDQAVDVVVNLQCDMPLIAPSTVSLVAKAAAELEYSDGAVAQDHCQVASCYSVTPASGDVRVVLDGERTALYFSRLPLPGAFCHQGVYGFGRRFLERGQVIFRQAPESKFCPLRQAEGLEQLAWLEQGVSISMYEVPPTPSLNTPDDLRAICEEVERAN